jgi:hypothetical protein
MNQLELDPLHRLDRLNQKQISFESQELCFDRRFHYCYFKHQKSSPPRIALILLILHSMVYMPLILPIFCLLWAYFYKNAFKTNEHAEYAEYAEFAWLVGSKKPYAFVKYKNYWLNAHIECILQNNDYIKLNIYLPYSSLKTLENSHALKQDNKRYQAIQKILARMGSQKNQKNINHIKNLEQGYLFSKPLIELTNLSPEAHYFLNTLAKASI